MHPLTGQGCSYRMCLFYNTTTVISVESLLLYRSCIVARAVFDDAQIQYDVPPFLQAVLTAHTII